MKRFTSTLALIIITFATAFAVNSPSERINDKTDQATLQFIVMQKDAHLVLSKYARMQARNTQYTFNILSSRITFDYKIALYNDWMFQKNQTQKMEAMRGDIIE